MRNLIILGLLGASLFGCAPTQAVAADLLATESENVDMKTSLSGIDLAIVVVYVVSLLAYGLYQARNVKTSEDFLVAGRTVGILGLTSTLVMAELNSATLMAFAGIGYSAGFSAMVLPFFVFSGPFLVYAVTVAKKWKRLNAVSVNALFSQRFGDTTSLVTTIVLILVYSWLCSVYLKAAAFVFEVAFGIGLTQTVLIMCSVVLCITLAGGLMSVIWTDVVSFLITIVVIPIMFVIAWQKAGGMEGLSQVYPEQYLGINLVQNWSDPVLSTQFMVAFFFLIVLIYFSMPHIAQRVFAGKSERTAFWAVCLNAVITACLYALVMGAAALAKTAWPDLTGETMSLSFAHVVVDWLPTGLRGVTLGIIFAICQTTMCAIWNTDAAMIENDVYSRFINPNPTDRERLLVSRVVTVLLGVLTIILALTLIKYLMTSLLITNILLAMLFFPCVTGFYVWQVNQQGALASMAVCLATGVVTMVMKWGPEGLDFNSWMPIYVSAVLPLTFVAGIATSLLTKTSAKETAMRLAFYERVGPPVIGRKHYLAAKAAADLQSSPSPAGP